MDFIWRLNSSRNFWENPIYFNREVFFPPGASSYSCSECKVSVRHEAMLLTVCEGMAAPCHRQQAEVLTEGAASCTQTTRVSCTQRSRVNLNVLRTNINVNKRLFWLLVVHRLINWLECFWNNCNYCGVDFFGLFFSCCKSVVSQFGTNSIYLSIFYLSIYQFFWRLWSVKNIVA